MNDVTTATISLRKVLSATTATAVKIAAIVGI